MIPLGGIARIGGEAAPVNGGDDAIDHGRSYPAIVFADLLSSAGVAEHCELRSTTGFMALHGGLEAATWELARQAADRCDASLYGVVQPEGLAWHVPSKLYDPAHSAALRSFCEHVDLAISLHGYGGVRDRPDRWVTICVGGHDRGAAAVVGAELRSHLDGYVVLDDLDSIPPQYRGVHPANPVNRTRGAGVQIELPPRVRGTGAVWADPSPLLDALVAAVGRLRAAG